MTRNRGSRIKSDYPAVHRTFPKDEPQEVDAATGAGLPAGECIPHERLIPGRLDAVVQRGDAAARDVAYGGTDRSGNRQGVGNARS